MRKLQLICFCDKMCKNLVCVLILQFKALHNVKSAYVTLQNFTPDLQKNLHRYICHNCDIMQLWCIPFCHPK